MSACLCASTWGPYTQSVHRPGRTSYTTAAPKRSGGVFHVTTSVTRAPRDTALNQYLERPWPEDAGPCLHTNTRWCRSPWRAAPGSFLTMEEKVAVHWPDSHLQVSLTGATREELPYLKSDALYR